MQNDWQPDIGLESRKNTRKMGWANRLSGKQFLLIFKYFYFKFELIDQSIREDQLDFRRR